MNVRPPQAAAEFASAFTRRVISDVLLHQDVYVQTNARKTHTKIEVTRTAGNLFHAVAVLRALRGRTELSRAELRRAASAWFNLACPRKAVRKMMDPQHRKEMNEVANLRANTKRVAEVFLSTFTEELVTARPMNPQTGEKPPPASLWGHGMERAAREIDHVRAIARRPRLRLLEKDRGAEYMSDDEWAVWRATGSAMPKNKRFGAQEADFIQWFGTRIADERSFGTMYDLEALAWALPEMCGFLVYYLNADKKLVTEHVGPMPTLAERPYELLWNPSSMVFWPMVPLAQKPEAAKLARGLPVPCNQTDVYGDCLFRKLNITRADFGDFLNMYEMKPGDDDCNDELVASHFGVPAEAAGALWFQYKHEHVDEQDVYEAQLRSNILRQNKMDRTRHVAVSVKMCVDDCSDWRSGVAQRHLAEHDEQRDGKREFPFEGLDLTVQEFREDATKLAKRFKRLPTPKELADEFAYGTSEARALFKFTQDELRKRDIGMEPVYYEWYVGGDGREPESA